MMSGTILINLLLIIPIMNIVWLWFPKMINLFIYHFFQNYEKKEFYILFQRSLQNWISFISIFFGGFLFVISLLLWIAYVNNASRNADSLFYCYREINFNFFFLKEDSIITVAFGIDGISLFLILLTTFLFFICKVIAGDIKKEKLYFFTLLLVLEFIIICSFLVLDFLLFYVFFEALLIPMFLIIGKWGSRTRRMKAANYFLFYAFFGSLFMLIGIFIIYYYTGSTSWYSSYIYNYNLYIQKILWFLFFIGFAIKVPLWPFHIWLPEAHVEAPTIGSIILAGLLLKLGGYGFLRYVLPIFPDATKYFLPLSITLCVIGIVYASLTTLRQVDMKRIIAYSSVAHMSYGMLGIFSLNYYGIMGGLILMLAHGLVSSSLFYLVGILYDKYGTRLIKYYGGLIQVMPLFSFFFFFFTVANMGLPGLFIFVGEFLVTLGIYFNNTFAAVISVLASVLTVCYMILLYNRIIFGSLKIQEISFFEDISKQDFYILFIFTILTFFFGVYPQVLIDTILINDTVLKTMRLYY